MTLKTTIAVAATGLAALAGCGTESATDATQQGATKAQQAAQEQQRSLSPEEQQLLERAQALAGDVTTTAKGYVNQDVTEEEALSKAEDYQQRASDLADQAQQLPATARARARLARLSDQLRETTQQLQTSVDGDSGADQLQSSVDRLRDAASSTYNTLRGRVSSGARARLDDALKSLGA